MSDIEGMNIDYGVLCQECTCLIGEGVGYPRYCDDCLSQRKEKKIPQSKQALISLLQYHHAKRYYALIRPNFQIVCHPGFSSIDLPYISNYHPLEKQKLLRCKEKMAKNFVEAKDFKVKVLQIMDDD